MNKSKKKKKKKKKRREATWQAVVGVFGDPHTHPPSQMDGFVILCFYTEHTERERKEEEEERERERERERESS